MAHISKTQFSPYSVAQMFDLVADFSHYPEFLPFCASAVSTPISDNERNGTLFFNKGPFRKSFTTHNTMYPDGNPARIDIKLVNGPFSRLDGEWRFEAVGQGCHVTLSLNYEVKSGILNSALSGVFEWMAKAMVDAFCKESGRLYGKPSG